MITALPVSESIDTAESYAVLLCSNSSIMPHYPFHLVCVAGYLLYFHTQAKDGGIYYTTDLIDGMDLGGEVVDISF